MLKHSKVLTPVPMPVVQTVSGSPQRFSDLQARFHVAALARGGFDRVPPSMVARLVERSERNVYGWREPSLVGGLRAHDLLVCPRPFARAVVRGLQVALDGSPPPDGPSRSSLAALLARIASLLILTAQEDPKELSDEALHERIKDFDENEEALRRARAPYDQVLLQRKLRSMPQAPGLASAKGEG